MEPASVPICNCRQASASEVCYMELPELPCALDGSVNCNPHSKSSCHYVLSFPFRTTVRGFLYAMLLRRTPCSIMRRAFPLQPRHYDSHRTSEPHRITELSSICRVICSLDCYNTPTVLLGPIKRRAPVNPALALYTASWFQKSVDMKKAAI